MHAHRTGSCPLWSATTTRASSGCEACFARRLRATLSLRVRSTRMTRATRSTKLQSTTRSATAFWSYRRCRACTYFCSSLLLVKSTFCRLADYGLHRLATLPGEEDVDGLRKLLDPQTLAGRAARISLLTHGPGALSLATSTPGSPLSDSPVSFGWNRKIYRYSVPPTPRYSVPSTPIA